MHCTGFDLSYCCILPPYNSILAQIVKTSGAGRVRSRSFWLKPILWHKLIDIMLADIYVHSITTKMINELKVLATLHEIENVARKRQVAFSKEAMIDLKPFFLANYCKKNIFA